MFHSIRNGCALGAGALALLLTVTTQAQDEAAPAQGGSASPMLEEVYVTARRREESLQETPVAVSALGASALTEAGVSTITDLQQVVPGLQFAESGSKTPAIFIRGIGQREGSAVLDPGVGVYLNGIFLARQDTQLLDTVDTQSIQVLRGPQGTLFGKNNTGGAMLVTTKEPHADEFELDAMVRAGNYGRRDVKVSGNLPLVEQKLGLRFALNSKKYDGYLDNVLDGETFGDEERLAATARLLWNVSDTFSADLFVYWSRQDELSTALSCIHQNPASNISQLHWPGRPDFEPVCRASEAASENRNVTINSEDSVVKMTSTLTALTLNWEVGDVEVKSITAWSHQEDIERNDDQDATSVSMINNGSRALNDTLRANGIDVPEEERDQFSEELQVNGTAFEDRLQFTTGLFLSLETIENNPFAQLIGPKGLAGIDPKTISDALIPGLPSAGDGFVFPLATFFATRSDLENKSWAVFAQATWDIARWLQLTVGGRYTVERRERDLTLFDIDHVTYGQRIGAAYIDQAGFYSPIPRAQFDAIGQDIPDLPIIVRPSADVRSEKWTNFSPAVTLSVLASDSWLDSMNLNSALWYVTYSEGFKAGGFEPRGPELVPFEPEEVTNYELGMKLDAADSRLRINAALYQMDYSEIQVRVAEQGERISDIYLFLSNAGRATVRGAELETTLLLGNWVAVASANYTDAVYDEFEGKIVIPGQGEAITDRSDEPFALVPETSYSLALQYNWLTDIGLFVPRLQLYHRDEIFTGIDYLAIDYETSTLEALTLVNARFTYFPSENLRIAAYVNNLTDEEYFKSGFTVSAALGAATLVQGDARAYGVEFAYSF